MEKSQIQPEYAGLLKRAKMFLEDGEFDKAHEYAERVLDIDPECAEAYAVKLCCELKVKFLEELALQSVLFENNKNFVKALRFADNDFAVALKGCAQSAEQNCVKKNAHLNAQADLENRRLVERRQLAKLAMPLISAGRNSAVTLGVKKDGTVLSAGAGWDNAKLNFKTFIKWRNIKQICSCRGHAFGVRSNGTIAAEGVTEDTGYVTIGYSHRRVKKVGGWKNIVALSTGDKFTCGLRSDGTIIAEGNHGYYVKDMKKYYPDVFKINNAVAVQVIHDDIAVLKADGTVSGTGTFSVIPWKDIVSISCDSDFLLGLKNDGTVVAFGKMVGYYDVSQAQNVGMVSIDDNHTLVSSKTVLVANGKYGLDLREWREIAAISVGLKHSVGLKSDGTVVAFGENYCGQCEVWEWRDIIAISAGYGYTLGLKSDGTVVATGDNQYGQCNVSGWKLFDTIEDLYR